MSAIDKIFEIGQSLWLDDMTRLLLRRGTLRQYVRELRLTGLTSNPTIFDHAISRSADYDADIRKFAKADRPGEDVFFELAVADLRQAADTLLEVHERTGGVDGWASLEVSPLLADDTAATIAAATSLHLFADRSNLFIKIPGTKAGLPAIEEAIFQGVPVNVTLLFSREQYLAAAAAHLRGIERRVARGLDPRVASVASIFVSRWDVAVRDQVPEELRSKLGLAVAKKTYQAYLETLGSPRVQRLMNLGMRPQRLLWASTGTKDPKDPDTLYIDALAAPLTVNTMPEKTLKAFAEHGSPKSVLLADAFDADALLARFAAAGVDVGALAGQLQVEGAKSFTKSWVDLMDHIAAKGHA